MSNPIKLGNIKNPANHIKIDDPTVSSNHLNITYLNENEIMIEDVGSTNGTKILRANGQEIAVRKCTVSTNDKLIIIGQNRRDVASVIKEVKKIYFINKVVWYEEFSVLEKLFAEFQNKNKNLDSNFSRNTMFLKLAITAVFMVVILVYGNSLGIPQEARYFLSMIIGVVAYGISEKIFNKSQLSEKKTEVFEKYSSILVCPKCNHSLIGRSFSYWKNLRICPKCQANWVK
jgi:hypothetical protein